MNTQAHSIAELLHGKDNSPIRIYTLGQFKVYRDGAEISAKEWSRDKTLQLLQFLISNRSRSGIHKELIIDRLWDADSDRDFKVALHGIVKVLEPNRPARTESSYIIRNGLSYHINLSNIWIDIDHAEQLIIRANNIATTQPAESILLLRAATDLYTGTYLPNRLYEDWSSEERERMQILFLGAFTDLAQMIVSDQPMEAIRLAQSALQIDPTWEDAYRIQMEAYLYKGNRPMVIKTYQHCESILREEFGISPLPVTKSVLNNILAQ